MTDEKKQELFPYFAYIYSQKLNPEKYGQVNSIDEWTALIQESQDDINKITEAAGQLSDEEWESLEQQYAEQQQQSAQYAAKGAKLKKLKSVAKKCKCGCEMITIKEDGGKMTSKCACNCGGAKIAKATHKKRIGGTIEKPVEKNILQEAIELAKCGTKVKKKQAGGDVNSSQSQLGVAKKGGKAPNRIKKNEAGSKLNKAALDAVLQSVVSGIGSNPVTTEALQYYAQQGYTKEQAVGQLQNDIQRLYGSYLQHKKVDRILYVFQPSFWYL